MCMKEVLLTLSKKYTWKIRCVLDFHLILLCGPYLVIRYFTAKLYACVEDLMQQSTQALPNWGCWYPVVNLVSPILEAIEILNAYWFHWRLFCYYSVLSVCSQKATLLK